MFLCFFDSHFNYRTTAEDLVKDYLAEQNRPYNIQIIVDNMQKVIPKSLMQKTLDNLVAGLGRLRFLSQNMPNYMSNNVPIYQDGDLVMKDYGKSKIYHYNQAKVAEPSKEEVNDS